MTREFSATKVFAHRWPHDTPEWGSDFKNLIDARVNMSSGRTRTVTLCERSVVVSGCIFESITKVGVSVPFFKKECRMMFEGSCMGMHAHVHLYASDADTYLCTFDLICDWMRRHGY